MYFLLSHIPFNFLSFVENRYYISYHGLCIIFKSVSIHATKLIYSEIENNRWHTRSNYTTTKLLTILRSRDSSFDTMIRDRIDKHALEKCENMNERA